MRFRLALLTAVSLCAPLTWAATSDQYASYNTYNVQPIRPDLNLNQKLYQPVLPVFSFSIAPDFNIGIEAARGAQFQVRDLGVDIWDVNLAPP